MNLSVNRISVMSGNCVKSYKSNIKAETPSPINPQSFKGGAKVIRNTMLALAAMGSVVLAGCNGTKNSDYEKEPTIITTYKDNCKGMLPDNFTLTNPEVTFSDNGAKVSKSGEYTVTEVPGGEKIIRRDFSDGTGAEETIFFPEGDKAYRYEGYAEIKRNGEETPFTEKIYEHYGKNGELEFWVSKTADNLIFNPYNASASFDEKSEYKGCKRIRTYDDFGNVKNDYFVSKSGLVTNANVLDLL